MVEAKQGFHVVAVDPHTGPTGMPTVDSDNFAGAVLATNHLLGLGHRRIGFLGGRPDLESARLREAGLPHGDGRRPASASTSTRAGRRLPARDRRGPGPRAAQPARPADRGVRRQRPVRDRHDGGRRGLGLTVPDDLSVIGFDNVPESALAVAAPGFSSNDITS